MASARHEMPSIAITGLSCRFPGDCDGPSNFWSSICDGKSAWSDIPGERFNGEAFWSGRGKKGHGSITKSGHFLKDDVSGFDANFFSITRAEANAMDPQHRLMLEVTYEALESAGYPLDTLAGTRTGVFMGHFTGDYKELVLRDAEAMPPYATTGLNKTSLANRISWTFDLRGPSFSLDTACSSSLVAFHLACQSLRTGESDMAIVGGSNLLLNPEMFIAFSGQGFLSADGKCKSFDASGDGYGRGEGIAVVILKRVDDAIAARDPLRSVIRATGSNQDGHTKSLTLPRAEAQQALIQEVYERAGLDFSQTGYIEAHGTGTQAGDVEETLALSQTIAQGRTSSCGLHVGSVKANIGHLEAASGLAGVIKSVLMLENGLIPPNIHFKNPNPKIKFADWHIQIPTKLTPWPTQGLRRISINSFGYGGSNAHAILDDAYHYLQDRRLQGQHHTKLTNGNIEFDRSDNDDGQIDTPRVFVLTAQDRDGLARAKSSLAAWLHSKEEARDDDDSEFVADLAHTLNTRRSRLQWKTFALGSSLEELTESLGDASLEAMSSNVPHLGFVFTGQGAQWATMGTRLMAFPDFRSSIEAADLFLKKELGCRWSVQAELARGKATSRLGLALYSQTLCTVLQVALVDLLWTWGIVPEAVVGHSSGEIAAAYCAGFLGREDAWKIAYCRGVAAGKMKEEAIELNGAMMAVGASPERCAALIRETCPDDVDIACVNSPSSVTLSGDAAAIDSLQESLKEAGIFHRKLLVDTAYHSKHMQRVADGYRESIADINPLVGKGNGCRMHSSVTKSQVQATDLGPDYWIRNLVSPVQFAAAVEDLMHPSATADSTTEGHAIDVFVEIGPHNALQGPVTQTLQPLGQPNKPYLSALVRNRDQVETILNLVGSLAVYGLPVDLGRVNKTDANLNKTLIDLPSYAWNHGQQYWAESRLTRTYKQREAPASSLLGAPVPALSDDEHTWRGFLRPGQEAWVADHKIQGSVLYPGAGFLVMAVEAAVQSAEKMRGQITSVHLRDVEFLSAMVVSQDRELEHTVQLRSTGLGTSKRDGGEWMEFIICSSPDTKALVRNCYGKIRLGYQDGDETSTAVDWEAQSRYQEAADSCHTEQNSEDFYKDLGRLGLTYGPAFTNLSELSCGNGKSLGTLTIPDVGLETPSRPHIIHPATLDASFHLVFAAAHSRQSTKLTVPMVPRSLKELHLSVDIPYAANTNLAAFSDATVSRSKGELNAAITIMASPDAQKSALEISGLRLVALAHAPGSQETTALARQLCSKLVWKPAADLLNPEETQRIVEALSKESALSNGTSPAPKAGLGQLKEYLEILHHSRPDIRITELVGTSPLACDLGLSPDTTRTLDYTLLCADEDAKAQLQDSATVFQGAKVEALPSVQSSSQDRDEEERSDIILCWPSTVERARVIQSAKTLLKKGGRICLVGTFEEVADSKAVLLANEFTFQCELGQSVAGGHVISVASIGSSAVDPPNGYNKEPRRVVLVRPADMPDAGEALARQLEHRLSNADCVVTRHTWGLDDIAALQGQDCISFLELHSPLLETLQEKDFYALQTMIQGCSSLLWLDALDAASGALINGLARVVRNEMPGIRLRTLHAPSASLSKSEALSNFVVRLWDSETSDNEFRIQNEVLYASRVLEDMDLNASFSSSGTRKIDKTALAEDTEPLEVSVDDGGQAAFEPSSTATTQMGGDEVEITVREVAVSPHSFAIETDPEGADDLPMFTAAGTIRRIGSDVTQFRVGDSVVVYGRGSPQTVQHSKASLCSSLTEGFTFEEAVNAQAAHAAAWYGLVHIARVSKGQSILIHDGATEIGQAAISIARHYGLDAYATVDSEQEGALLIDLYGVEKDHILSSQDSALGVAIKGLTNGRGVDVIFNPPPADGVNLRTCLASFGTIIEAGLHDSPGSTQNNIVPRGATFSSFSLSRLATQRPELMTEIVLGVSALQQGGILRPIHQTVSTFPASAVQDAVDHVQNGGRATLSFQAGDLLPVVARPSMQSLSGEACYVLVGGLGGLGRSLAMMLAENGAKKLCFLSRSGASSVSARDLLRDLDALGLRVEAMKCDVSDPEACASSLQRCCEELGPVRGVIQCAMVLRDTLFTNMSYQDWNQSTLPKVQGTQNLHAALPNVDFFIALSSFAGTFGNRGQSNYAAGCAYQDALAIQRRGEGRAATSLDVGLMRDVGVLAETGMTEGLKDWEEPYGVRESELLDLVKLAIADRLPAQVLTGLATGGSALAAGIPMPFYLADAKFSIMAKTDMEEAMGKAGGVAGSAAAKQQDSVGSLVSKSKDTREAAGHVAAALVSRVAKLLELAEQDVDVGRALHSYGLDSLAAIELVDWALRELKARINVFDVMAAEPITATAAKIATASALVGVNTGGE